MHMHMSLFSIVCLCYCYEIMLMMMMMVITSIISYVHSCVMYVYVHAWVYEYGHTQICVVCICICKHMQSCADIITDVWVASSASSSAPSSLAYICPSINMYACMFVCIELQSHSSFIISSFCYVLSLSLSLLLSLSACVSIKGGWDCQVKGWRRNFTT